MKTNFKKPTKLVLLDDAKIMAIISVESGEQNIAEKVAMAIREDVCAKEVILDPSLKFEFKHGDYSFDAKVIFEDAKNELYNYSLVPVTEY